jgi:hypothetical protein
MKQILQNPHQDKSFSALLVKEENKPLSSLTYHH